jgi:hypothetical protein
VCLCFAAAGSRLHLPTPPHHPLVVHPYRPGPPRKLAQLHQDRHVLVSPAHCPAAAAAAPFFCLHLQAAPIDPPFARCAPLWAPTVCAHGCIDSRRKRVSIACADGSDLRLEDEDEQDVCVEYGSGSWRWFPCPRQSDPPRKSYGTENTETISSSASGCDWNHACALSDCPIQPYHPV